MKLISLTGKWGIGNNAIVDDDIYEKIKKWKWLQLKNGYPARNLYRKDKKSGVITPLHRFIMVNVPKGMYVDHINRNKLDNRRENLRIVSRNINALNCDRSKRLNMVGVSWHKGNRLWRTQISMFGKNILLGYFKNFEDASKKYQKYNKIRLKKYKKCFIID